MNKLEYTKKSVQGVLERLQHFQQLKEKGNVDAIIVMADIKEALKKCELTERQKLVFNYHFVREYRLDEVATKLNISRQAVIDHKKWIVTKVCKALNGGATV